ncbi:MAG: putative 4-hydroxybenzoate polyprenyltransferase [SAR202 cluster bacterium]|nr:putative 4-hydroxybenzoate polyprenyltransferase [SAR202 cluster bacterium]
MNNQTSKNLINKTQYFFQAIKFQESIFALPFAYIGMILSIQKLPTIQTFLWITIAMITARTFGMAMNRIIDNQIDSKNPRTAERHIPKGLLSIKEVLVPTLASALIFFFASFQLNLVALILAPIALLYLSIYPYTKRFTWTANILLGWALAIAPSAAWIGVTGSYNIIPFLLSLAVAFWAGSFDILYHSQDIEFQSKNNLHSVAKKFGIKNAFLISKIMDVLSMMSLLTVGFILDLNYVYFFGCLSATFLMIYKYMLISPDDLSKMGIAFLRINAFVSCSMLLGTLLAII